ncbi:MAG: UbiA family prenyltransferase [Candidatus Dormibacteria bacterium]
MSRRTAWALLRSCHPEPTLAVTAFISVLALRWGRGAGTLWVALAVLCGQFSVGWANDYLDRDLDAGRADKPLANGELAPATVRRAAIVGLVLAVGVSLLSGLAATGVHVIGLGLAHAYNFRLKRSILSAATYAIAFAMAPAFVTLGLASHRLPPTWVMVAAALLGAGAHFTQTLGDHDRDREAGIRGLPQVMGRRASVLAAGVLLGAAALVATLGPGRPALPALALLTASLVLVAGTVITGLAGRFRDSFHLTIGAAGTAVLALLVGTGSGFS